jgi:hypothetical protein
MCFERPVLNKRVSNIAFETCFISSVERHVQHLVVLVATFRTPRRKRCEEEPPPGPCYERHVRNVGACFNLGPKHKRRAEGVPTVKARKMLQNLDHMLTTRRGGEGRGGREGDREEGGEGTGGKGREGNTYRTIPSKVDGLGARGAKEVGSEG